MRWYTPSSWQKYFEFFQGKYIKKQLLNKESSYWRTPEYCNHITHRHKGYLVQTIQMTFKLGKDEGRINLQHMWTNILSFQFFIPRGSLWLKECGCCSLTEGIKGVSLASDTFFKIIHKWKQRIMYNYILWHEKFPLF